MTTDRLTDLNETTRSAGLLRLIVAGAPVDNDNRGVEALGTSVVEHLSAAAATERVSVFDGGWGVRDHQDKVELVGVRTSRRWHRRESWTRIRIDQLFGGLGNPVVGRLRRADALLDLSGGDSFTDLYGLERLSTVCAPKEAALRARCPLVLLPQTFGPFTTAEGRRRAERLVRESQLAYARDAWSYEQLRELAGPDFNETRLRSGVDVAFALGMTRPDHATVERLGKLSGEVLAGVNVSGLLRDGAAGRQFGLAGDYVETMAAMVSALIEHGAFIIFVPHVHGEHDGENDATVIELVQSMLTPTERERTWMLPARLRAAELKWCISRMDWFIGARMHATIAALSTRVPTLAYAYSDKAHGVFATCGVADQVADARTVTGPPAVELAVTSFLERSTTRAALATTVPAVVDRSRKQLDEVLEAVASWGRGGVA